MEIFSSVICILITCFKVIEKKNEYKTLTVIVSSIHLYLDKIKVKELFSIKSQKTSCNIQVNISEGLRQEINPL